MNHPVLIATWSFALEPCRAALATLVRGGTSLDAVEAVCCAVEDDPGVDSVGYGGLPDRDGDVTTDGCIMRSPRECGSVCAVRRHRHAVSIARLVMERTAHVMLAGEGADRFAEEHGLMADDVCSDEARERWQRWRAQPHRVDQSRDGASIMRPMDGVGGQLFPGGTPRTPSGHDTIGVLGIDGAGVLAGACSTSGTPYKIPGRVGDAPIIGHGLYVDPNAGAATATGTGELVMSLCSSFHVVELMRQGAAPREALRTALLRIGAIHDLKEEHQVAMIALRPDGTRAAAALRPGFRWVIADADGARVVEPEVL